MDNGPTSVYIYFDAVRENVEEVMENREQTTDVNSLVKCQEYPLEHSNGGIVDIIYN
jgi:hypothetical protein